MPCQSLCLLPAPGLFAGPLGLAATGHELMVTGSKIINHILVFPGLFLGHHLRMGLPHLEHRGVRDIQCPSLT